MSDKVDPGVLTPELLAKILSTATRRKITVEQVAEIAEAGNLISKDGSLNFASYIAFLIGEKHGRQHSEHDAD